ncbi:MAG: hypothetical protein R3C28_26040 [Pirellulaceae bacterium]
MELKEQVDELPNICGQEELIDATLASRSHVPSVRSDIDWNGIHSGFAVALHMHQPLIPAGGDDLKTAKIISNLKDMLIHPSIGDNHNSPAFHWCYKRMGEFIPQLVDEGKQPRIMLEYSGCLLHGLREMGLSDVLDHLKRITCDAKYWPSVEWLGAPWGHAVAPSTPVQDFRLHVRAWQHHFASIFGLEALKRVRGFSPSEMALPNHPDVCFEFVKTLRECGYEWLVVQEHTIEQMDGQPVRNPHVPHLLVAKNSTGRTASIVAIIKTQGSDTKLVGQMQPYYEALGLFRHELAGHRIPQLVTQIADGENGGVMMNEFPSKFMEVMFTSSGSSTPALNTSEYLDYLRQMGIRNEDFPQVQPVLQHRIWEHWPEQGGPDILERKIHECAQADSRFTMEGGSWTNDISWVRGYENVLGPMTAVSAAFAQKALRPEIKTNEARYRNALFHLMIAQTSCFRYWGHGVWTEYGREICRRAMDILNYDF